MVKEYQGKLGIGQAFFCIIAIATLAIPFALDPMVFTFNLAMPIGGPNYITNIQEMFVSAVIDGFAIQDYVPEIVTQLLPYSLYAFYAVIAYDFLFIILLMILRFDGLRVFFRIIGVLLGFVLLAVAIIALATVVGFVMYYLAGDFGDGASILDCIKNNGVLFYLGVTIFAFIATGKQFFSFFGRY